jgi:hypothetical protein
VKDQYAGDENDYVKFGLLRALCGSRLSTFIAWLRTPNDGRTDGRRLGYLETGAGWRDHDPPLFDALQQVASKAGRSVKLLETHLPLARASFYSDLVPGQPEARRRWSRALLERARDRDLLFFDPDNGLEVASVPSGSRNFTKYVGWDEVEAAFAQGHSVLIYQHFRREDRTKLAARLLRQLSERTESPLTVGFRTAHVLFLLAAAPAHRSVLERRLERIEPQWASRIAIQRGPSVRGTSRRGRPRSRPSRGSRPRDRATRRR